MALQIDINSDLLPIQILIPIGFPPEPFLNNFTNSISSKGVENAECVGGDKISFPFETKRIAAISSVTFSLGKIPP